MKAPLILICGGLLMVSPTLAQDWGSGGAAAALDGVEVCLTP